MQVSDGESRYVVLIFEVTSIWQKIMLKKKRAQSERSENAKKTGRRLQSIHTVF